MGFKIAMTVLSAVLATAAHSAVDSDLKEFGHWLVMKRTDDFNPNNASCFVENGGWYPATLNSPEIISDGKLRIYFDNKALTSSGAITEGFVAMFSEWDNAAETYVYAGDLFEDGADSKGNPHNVVGKVDGKLIDFASPNLSEELKGKVDLTYRYTAFFLDNSPVKTNTISLIGFTQAWNYATELCNG